MHFIVKGRTGRGPETVTWRDGVIEGDSYTLEVLERRAKLMEEDKAGPVAISTGLPGIPQHLSDPMMLIYLLIYETTFPPILDQGEIVELDIPQMELPKGAIG